MEVKTWENVRTNGAINPKKQCLRCITKYRCPDDSKLEGQMKKLQSKLEASKCCLAN